LTKNLPNLPKICNFLAMKFVIFVCENLTNFKQKCGQDVHQFFDKNVYKNFKNLSGKKHVNNLVRINIFQAVYFSNLT